MNQNLTREQKMRKMYIELLVDKLYTRFSDLFTDSKDIVTQNAMDKYFNSSMTIPEITEDMVKTTEEMKKNRDKQIESENSKENTVIKEDTNKPVDNEINTMLEDKPKEEIIEVNSDSLEKPKQFVKENNNDTGSKGFVSLFSIGLSILAVTGFILIAMILNLLLK